MNAAPAAGFTDTAVISGLNLPTAAAIASDGRVFISEKSGVVKTFDSLEDITPTVAVDLSDKVMDFWDRGLLGLTVDPSYPTRPYIYVLYGYDAPPGGTHPTWGDACPTPPGATEDGCVITGRLSRITVGADGVATGEETVLITDWCQQYPSHSVNTVAFGPDGALYLSAGEGGNFVYADYGQDGNPCGDPPGPAGTDLTPPDAKGGALRAQSPRRADGEPVVLNGSILRIDPDTGAGLPDNPFASSTNANAQRVIAYGMRNPFRFDFRPGTAELWSSDVGWNAWEEINRIADTTDQVAENFGWPCYEGAPTQPGYDDANLTMCESLYSDGGHSEPYYAYGHDDPVLPDDGCLVGGSSASGIAFEDGSNFPDAYDGALFFSDSSRGCVWAMPKGADGEPDPTKIELIVADAATPVHLFTGPGGDLFYVALGAGQLRRISYIGNANRAPTAVATADPTSGGPPLKVRFDGTGSTDPDADTLRYAWDLDGDGAYDDSKKPQPRWKYRKEQLVTVGLKVTDQEGLSGTTTIEVIVGDPPLERPQVTIDTPTTELNWKVGQEVPFAGTATDDQDGALPAAAMSWQLTVQHCHSENHCHSHPVQRFGGVSSGTFIAPDHDYPSYLDLTLTATDSDGNTGSTTVRLDPLTVELIFTSNPYDAVLTVGGTSQTAPFSRTVIVGSANSISAPSPQLLGPSNTKHIFVGWSDGGAATHNISAPDTPTTYDASFFECPNC